MSGQADEEAKALEEKLGRALDEAWTKVNRALELRSSEPSELAATLHQAAEAVEFSSALFSLTYDLEDFDPEVKIKRNSEPTSLVKESLELLRKTRELRRVSSREAYSNLRTAADYLKTAFLRQSKKPRVKTG